MEILTDSELNWLKGHLSNLEKGIKQGMGNYTPDEYLQQFKVKIKGCLKKAEKEAEKRKQQNVEQP